MSDFEVFIKRNNLKKTAIAQYIGVSNGFITQIINGSRRLPHDKLLKIIANPDWDVSMFGEGNMLKDQSVSTNSDTTNQQQNDMTIQELLEAIKRRDQQMDEMLSQQGRLISIIENMSGTSIKQSHVG